MIPRIVVVDFDGTLVDFDYPRIGPLKQGAREALVKFRELGYQIIISSCRSSSYFLEIFCDDPNQPIVERPVMVAMKKYLDDNQVPYDEIDDGSRGKPLGNIYIDDKGLRFENNWAEIQEWVEVNKP